LSRLFPPKVARDLIIGRTMKGNEVRFVVPIRTVPVKHQDEFLSSLLPKRSQDMVNESVDKDVRPLANESLDVATRPDDAEAEDWDKWLVSSGFVCPYSKAPLVCRGGYDAERHGPLFEGMRKLLIRRYRRNVLRSYLSFMRKNHGNDEVQYTVASSGN